MFTTLIASAASSTNTIGTPIKNAEEALGFISVIANWMFAVLITVAVIYVLLAAWQYLTSGGGEGVESAHKMLLYAAIAIAVAVLARGIVAISARIAGQTEGVNFVEPK